mgnify:FL=1
MKKITLSINPTYFCNFRCDFCYLTKEQLGDKKTLRLEDLKCRLRELQSYGYQVDHVDLYGGEIALLGDSYLDELDKILEDHGDPSIAINTNYSRVIPYFLKEHVDLSVSFDFEARQSSDIVLQNIMGTPKEVAILVLASPEVLKMDIDLMIRTFNHISNIKTVEIKPYSTNQANQLAVTFKEYEDFVRGWIESPIPKRFVFENENLIQESLFGTRNAFSDDDLYITPEGKFAVLEFDENDHEFFLSLDSVSDYELWSEEEKKNVLSNSVCEKCEYKGVCLTEHYRVVTNDGPSCSGFKGLLDWSRESSQFQN